MDRLSLIAAFVWAGCGSFGLPGGGGSGGDGSYDTCRKIDLVISVDPSGSMDEELLAMANPVFPLLAERLLEVGDGLEDYRVGVIDACPQPAAFHTTDASGASCNFQSGQVWMESRSDRLIDEFSCVGNIDRQNNCSGDNDDEQPASAAAAALEPPFLTGANAGFLREDALLVIMAITDEDEQPTAGSPTPQALYDRLVALKGGNPRRMVFYGIGGGSGGCSPGAYGDADHAELLEQTTNLFAAEGRGVWQDLCGGNLEDGLAEAMRVIDSACEDLPEEFDDDIPGGAPDPQGPPPVVE